MKYGRLFGALTLVAGVGFASATGVAAQEPVPADPVPQEPVEVEIHEHPQIEITEELMERFVVVYPTVMEIAQEAQVELATVETPEDAQAIQASAQERIAAILAESDVTVEEYEAVVARLNEDEELRLEFEQMLEEHLAEDPLEQPGA